MIEDNKDIPEKEKNHVVSAGDAPGDAPVPPITTAANVLYQVDLLFKFI